MLHTSDVICFKAEAVVLHEIQSCLSCELNQFNLPYLDTLRNCSFSPLR